MVVTLKADKTFNRLGDGHIVQFRIMTPHHRPLKD